MIGALALAGCTVSNAPPPAYGPGPTGPAAPQPGGDFDPTGWVLLGNQSVDGARDRDAIAVGAQAGRFDQLMLVVNDSDLELMQLTVLFANGQAFAPPVRHVFREGSRSRAIELPGDDRALREIEIVYGNVPGGGRATVEIYGHPAIGPVAAAPPMPPAPMPPPAPSFDAAGWTLLGQQSVEGRRDRDVIQVGKQQGRFDRLTLVVQDSDLELHSMTITFGNGTTAMPEVRHTFREGQRSRVIDLPGNDRFIRSIELRYGNLPGGGRARVEIWGRNTRG